MTNLRGDALQLNDTTLPSSGYPNEIRYDTASGELRRWDANLTTWVALGGAGGGGSAIQFDAVAGTSPSPEEEFGLHVWNFEAGKGNELTAMIKVPASYNAGSQISLKAPYYTPGTTGTTLLFATSYLVKDGQAIDSIANAHPSTNTAAAAGSPANEYQVADIDITDVNGEINSVAVAAGDIIRVKLLRGSDTETANIKFIPSATELEI